MDLETCESSLGIGSHCRTMLRFLDAIHRLPHAGGGLHMQLEITWTATMFSCTYSIPSIYRVEIASAEQPELASPSTRESGNNIGDRLLRSYSVSTSCAARNLAVQAGMQPFLSRLAD